MSVSGAFLFAIALGFASGDSKIVFESMKTYNFNKSLHGVVGVPGGVFSQTLKRARVPPLLEGSNDVATRWLSRDTWMFHTAFNVTKAQLKHGAARLTLEGVDTVAAVRLNGETIGNTDNMFIRYTHDVKELLKTDRPNNLSIIFQPPAVWAQARSQRRFTAPACVPGLYHGECHANQLRKMQMSFGWDWGPAFPSIGLWKPAYLEFLDGVIITDVTATPIRDSNNQWELKGKIFYETLPSNTEMNANLEFQLENMRIRKNIKLSVNYDGKGVKDYHIKVPKNNKIETWWPNGAGAQKLYVLRVFLGQHGTKPATKNITIGFRTIELVQQNISTHAGNVQGDGLTFYFKVNGFPMFMKGTNWIPSDVLPENTYNETTVRSLLQSVRDANMNMVRVWGGGAYESDLFYAACDELGILVWQDFMFACSMYPTDDEYLASVRKEVESTVLRLQSHASIAVWAANNENEAALRSNWYDTEAEFDRYKTEYVKLNVDTIRPIVAQYDPERSYLTSSPTNGLQSEREGYIAENPYDIRFGDTHYYNYIFDNWDQNIVPLTRFASEYGVQSIPSRETMETAAPGPGDLDISSKFMQHRQHLAAGYQFMAEAIEKRLGPTKGLDFDTFVYYSQISQAMSIKTMTEFYRQSQSTWFTMGALYWQLNDVWQAPSWSSIEYGGKWKILHYFARTFFEPILVSPRLLDTGEVHVYVLNDGVQPLNDSVVQVDIFQWDSLTPVSSTNYSVGTVARWNSTKVLKNQDFLQNRSKVDVFFRFRLAKPISSLPAPPLYNYVFPAPLKSVNGLKKPSIRFQVVSPGRRNQFGKYDYGLQLHVDTVVLFLWLESTAGGHFSDNGFIVTDDTRFVKYTSQHYFKYEKDLIATFSFKYYLNK